MLAIWVGGPFYAFRAIRPSGRNVVDFTPCWKCGKQETRLFWVEASGTVHNEHYLREKQP